MNRLLALLLALTPILGACGTTFKPHWGMQQYAIDDLDCERIVAPAWPVGGFVPLAQHGSNWKTCMIAKGYTK
jgi:hypothetical protein